MQFYIKFTKTILEICVLMLAFAHNHNTMKVGKVSTYKH